MSESATQNEQRFEKAKLPLWASIITAMIILGEAWRDNLIEIFKSDRFGLLEVARVIGVPVFPIGVVLGLPLEPR